MAGKKSSKAAVETPASADTADKAELQRRMEEAREDISNAVAEIKDTVTNKYESVKESISETLDWREHFRKHSAAWSLGALALGYFVGSTIASSLSDTGKKRGKKDGIFSELAAVGEALSEEFSGLTQTVLAPALVHKIKTSFGIDLSDALLSVRSAMRKRSAPKKISAKRVSTRPSKKSSKGKRATKKTATKKGRK